MTPRAERVPDAEMDVLVILRRQGDMAAADLVRALAPTRPMSHGSVGTLLARLEAKGLVTRRRQEVGKAFLFSATPRAEGALRRAVEGLMTRVFGGDRMAMVASLLDARPLDADELARLDRVVAGLAAARRRRGGKGRR